MSSSLPAGSPPSTLRSHAVPVSLPGFVVDHGDGVFAIDTGFQRDRFDAAWLVVDDGEAAFIDTGTALAVPRLLAALHGLGLGVDAVRYVIPTHVHLDHAGGVGTLMQQLARHLVDPSALWQGALAVYGADTMARDYGELQPVPAERVSSTHDGQRLVLGGRGLRVADTPGHARHHHCLFDERSRGWFTGDTFGIAYPELQAAGRPFLFPTTTPVQFEPEAMQASIARLMAEQPARMYLTHYGCVEAPATLAPALLARLDETVAMARATAARVAADAAAETSGALEHALIAAMAALLRTQAQAHGCALPPAEIDALLAGDAQLNGKGLAVWLQRGSRRPDHRIAGPSRA